MTDRGLVVGYDTRFASEHFGAAVAEVAAGNGVRAYLCEKAAPTPVICFEVLERKAAGGVVITASHNPAIWNGFKYKSESGGAASPEVVADIEERIPSIIEKGGVKRISQGEGISQGLIEKVDPFPAYFRHLGSLVDLEGLRQAGLRIAVDSMYGAGAGCFHSLLGEGRTEILEINGERNPFFPGIQPEPIAQHLGKLCTLVRERGAAVGLATDGDADRLGVVDEGGRFLTQLQVFALLALYFLEVRGERGPIIKTITTTSMAYRLGESFGVPVYETPVGFKFVGPKMMAEHALLGGEESGGYGFRGHVPERDGILAGLYFLDLMVRLNKSPSQLLSYLYSKTGPHYYDRIDLHFAEGEREAILKRLSQSQPAEIDGSVVVSRDTLDGFRYHLEDGSWLLIRFSGTEPLLRIYTETSSQERVARILAEGRKLVGV
jgi:phosphomannomutase